MESLSIFVIGATGYIGGSVLVRFIQQYPEHTYTALVRNSKDNAAIEALGARVVQGGGGDVDLIEKVAAEHDVVLNCADADDLGLTTAILKGLFTRAKEGKAPRKPILLHTSGTGVLGDTWEGRFIPGVSEKIYDDANVEDIRNIAPEKPHRNVDLEIFAAGETKLIDTYIIAPSTIYGRGTGPVRFISVQANKMIRIALQNKQVLQVGDGSNIWCQVHIEDLVDLYMLVFSFALSGNNTSESPYENWFFGSVSEFTWGSVATELGRILFERGLVDTKEVKSVTRKEARLTPSNSRSVANRGKALGWKPERTVAKSLLETLPEEVDWTIESDRITEGTS